MAEIQDLINYQKGEAAQQRAIERAALDEEKAKLDQLKFAIEEQGGKASLNADFNKASLAIQQRELDLRKQTATGAAAKEEIAKEQRVINEKQGTLLGKISNGISGMLGNMKEKSLAVGGGFAKILKGTLFAGLFFALAAFFNSPKFQEMAEFIADKLVPGLIRVGSFIFDGLGKLFTGITALFEGDFSKAFDNLFSVKAVAALAAITALFAPGLLFKGLALGVKLFGKAIGGSVKFLANQGRQMERINEINRRRAKAGKGRLGRKFGLLDKVKNVAARVHDAPTRATKSVAARATPALSKAGNVLTGGLKVLGSAARFAGPIGAVVTAGMGLFDGISAGIEEYKKSGKIGAAVKEGFAGTLSGLTFGLVSQETISKGFDSIGNAVSTGFNKIKDDALAGVDKLKELAGPAVDKLKEIGSNLKEKFTALKDKAGEFIGNVGDKIGDVVKKLPSVSEVGSKISSFFGFGGKEKKVDDIANLKVLDKEIAQTRKDIKDLMSKQAEDATDQEFIDAELSLLKQKIDALNKSALARAAGGDAASININAPADNKVTTSTTTNSANITNISNPDPLVRAAMADF